MVYSQGHHDCRAIAENNTSKQNRLGCDAPLPAGDFEDCHRSCGPMAGAGPPERLPGEPPE
eukprot:15432893-Alexandrium_andersonii.AAC.1